MLHKTCALETISASGTKTQQNFLANHSLKPCSGKSNIYDLRYSIKGQLDRNKFIYIISQCRTKVIGQKDFQ
jgi:hypothetical protein